MHSKRIILGIVYMALAVCFFSCTIGEYMSLKDNENAEILGIVKTDFQISGSFRYRKAIDSQAYMNLLVQAQKEYGNNVDVRDITWAIGKTDTANNNYEYTAVGKAVRFSGKQ